jgi:hypothetical protein
VTLFMCVSTRKRLGVNIGVNWCQPKIKSSLINTLNTFIHTYARELVPTRQQVVPSWHHGWHHEELG